MGMVEDISQRLEDDGIGTQGTDIYLHEMQDAPNTCVALYSFAGEPPVRAMGEATGTAVKIKPRLQVRCRAKKASVAYAKALDIWKKLHNLGKVTLSGTVYDDIQALNPEPFLAEVDQNDRSIFAVNYELVSDL